MKKLRRKKIEIGEDGRPTWVEGGLEDILFLLHEIIAGVPCEEYSSIWKYPWPWAEDDEEEEEDEEEGHD